MRHSGLDQTNEIQISGLEIAAFKTASKSVALALPLPWYVRLGHGAGRHAATKRRDRMFDQTFPRIHPSGYMASC